jgi:hypothetical protein
MIWIKNSVAVCLFQKPVAEWLLQGKTTLPGWQVRKNNSCVLLGNVCVKKCKHKEKIPP